MLAGTMKWLKFQCFSTFYFAVHVLSKYKKFVDCTNLPGKSHERGVICAARPVNCMKNAL